MKRVKIKNNLRKYRKRLGITQAELAEAVGVSRTTVGNIERMQTRPRYYTAIKISFVLKVPLEKVFKVEEIKKFRLE